MILVKSIKKITIWNDPEQKQLRDEIKKAHSKCVPNPFQITELELDIRTFRPKMQIWEPPNPKLYRSS
jgi:hypothetical protein